MPHATHHIVNNILNRAFEDKTPITTHKLQRILYITASEYHKNSGHPLLSDRFEPLSSGPTLRTVHEHYLLPADAPIKHFIKNAEGEALMINQRENPNLQAALNTTWKTTKHRGAITLSDITRAEGSAWWKARENHATFLTDQDILEDTTYQTPLNTQPRQQTPKER